MAEPDSRAKHFRPGDLAPVSGIYHIIHANNHRSAHDALLIRGEVFPPCRICKGEVLFVVMQHASHMTHDWDFAGPNPFTVHPTPHYANVRAHPRHPVELPVVVSVSRGPNQSQRLYRGLVLELGEGGLAARLDAMLPPGDEIMVNITVPDNETLELPVRLRHVVAPRYGFEFVRVSEAKRQRLHLVVAAASARAAAAQVNRTVA